MSTYVLLMETNEEEHESWYNFIKVQGNEENIEHLRKQLCSFDWYLLDGLSTFDLEEFKFSEKTAKEMTKVALNHCFRHRKFDGVLKKIDFNFKPKHSVEKRMKRVNKVLNYGRISEFIEGAPDVDPEDVDPIEEESSTSHDEESSEEETSSSEEEQKVSTKNKDKDSNKDSKNKDSKNKDSNSKLPKSLLKKH